MKYTNTYMNQKLDVRLTYKPVSPQSVFVERDSDPNYNAETLLLETEKRIGFTLPEGLRNLYRIQNGGQINNLCIPTQDGTEFLYEHVCFPFGGYNDLNPLERLKTLKEIVLGYASEDDPEQAHEFPVGCENMIVLARWNDRTLFLDYNRGPAARISFTNFVNPNWKAQAIIWENFNAFFGALRHYEE